MEIIFGDVNLDSTLCISYNNNSTLELYERTVRKYQGSYIIHCTSLDKYTKENYFVVFIYPCKKLEIFFKENLSDIESSLEKKIEWAIKLNHEIVSNKTTRKNK